MKVHFQRKNQWPRDGAPAAMLLEPCVEDDGAHLARVARRDGLEGFVQTGPEPSAFFAPEVPVFDDLLALWFLLDAAPPGLDERHAEALCDYAEAARQALDPRSVPVRLRPRAVLESIRRSALGSEASDRDQRFLERSFELFDHLAERMSQGVDLFGPALFEHGHPFRQEIERLEEDARLYEVDRDHGRVFRAQVSKEGRVLEVALLLVHHPQSRMFVEWARADERSPVGRGFDLLLILWDDKDWVLSSAPRLELDISAVAAALQQREERKTESPLEEDWYDGHPVHDGTIIGSPKRGTALTEDEILSELRRVIRLRRSRLEGPERSWPSWLPWSLAGLGIAVTVAVALPRLLPEPPPEAPPPAPPPGESTQLVLSRGDQMSEPAELDALATEIAGHESFALIVGVSEYARINDLLAAEAASGETITRFRDLAGPSNDTVAIATLLVSQYGYEADNVILLLDDLPDDCVKRSQHGGKGPWRRALELPGLDGQTVWWAKPTEENFARAVEDLSDRSADKEREGIKTSFFFHYAGHAWRRKEDATFAQIFFEPPQEKFEGEYIPNDAYSEDIDNVRQDVDRRIHADAKLLLFDACHSAHVEQRASEEFIPFVSTYWDEKVIVSIAAAGRHQYANELEQDVPGTASAAFGVLSAATLRALELREEAPNLLRPAADQERRDGFVTHGELFSFIVKDAERQRLKAGFEKERWQDPRLFEELPSSEGEREPVAPLEDGTTPIGQFLLVPGGWSVGLVDEGG